MNQLLHPKPSEVLVAIWARGHDSLDSLIKLFTHGRGTHAAFVRGNGKIIENFFPRVREREFNEKDLNSVEIYRIVGSTKTHWKNLEKWFDQQLDSPPGYSIRDLFRYAFNMPPTKDSSCFCSEWVLRGIRLNLPEKLQPLVRLPYKDWASPRDLRISPRLQLIEAPVISKD